MPISGFIPANFPANLVLDSGVLYVGSSIFAATRNGLKFDPGIQTKQPVFDGKRSDIVGLDRITGWASKITGECIEMSQALIAQYLPGSTSSGGPLPATVTHTPRRAGVMFATGEYLTNVRCVWEKGDHSGFVQVRFPKAYMAKWSIDGKDNDDAGIPVQIDARLDMSVGGANIADCPFVWEELSTLP